MKYNQIEFCLTEWSTGVCKQIKFKEKTHYDLFIKHRDLVKGWNDVNSTVTENIRRKLSNRLL